MQDVQPADGTHERQEDPCDRRWIATLGRWFMLAVVVLPTGCALIRPGLDAGQESRGPWWMQQTALTRDGRLELTTQPWWSRAASLKLGEQFIIEDAGPASGKMLVRRESLQRRGASVEAIVWCIDDDGDGSISRGGDAYADCYVADYHADGIVDRMVDYIDVDRDRVPDDMDIRYFQDGQLRSVWCGVDLDNDGQMWDLAGLEYSSNFFKSDPYGANMIYMNKFNPQEGRWIPISECPFAFYDTDDDGQSEVVVRFSAVPISYDTSLDPDYANDAVRYLGPWDEVLRHMGVVNVRYSFDIDGLSSDQTPLHYDFGYNLVGATPYRFVGMEQYNRQRRPPQMTYVAPYRSVCGIADRFHAEQTGFSWSENVDDTIAIGGPPHAADDRRWEGVFWIWERRFMGNTGGPCQKWNIRREWSSKPSDTRELYYSKVDRKIHLFGAEEGWIEMGHFAGLGKLGETRMFDTDGNGYFDRWEVYDAKGGKPLRVTTVRDEQARRIPSDYPSLCRFYMNEVVPQARDATTRLLAAFQRVSGFKPSVELAQAMETGSPGYRQYAADIACEMAYAHMRAKLGPKSGEVLRKSKMNDLLGVSAAKRAETSNSQTAWHLDRLLTQLEVAYGSGEVEVACRLIDQIEKAMGL